MPSARPAAWAYHACKPLAVDVDLHWLPNAWHSSTSSSSTAGRSSGRKLPLKEQLLKERTCFFAQYALTVPSFPDGLEQKSHQIKARLGGRVTSKLLKNDPAVHQEGLAQNPLNVETESLAEGLEGVVALLPVQHALLVLQGEEVSDKILFGEDGRSRAGVLPPVSM
jgi:hypothetical protein